MLETLQSIGNFISCTQREREREMEQMEQMELPLLINTRSKAKVD